VSFTNVLGPLVTLGMLAPNTQGLESLAQGQNTSTAALTLNFPARDGVMCFIWWKFAVADRLSVSFNGAAAGNTEHWSRVFTAGDFQNLAVTFSNFQEASQPGIRLVPAAVSVPCLAVLSLANTAGTAKPAFFAVQQSTGSPATIGQIENGAGEWVSATNPVITSMKFEGVAANLMSIRVGVYGRAFP